MIRETRFAIVRAVMMLFALALIGRAAKVQIWEHDSWNSQAERQHNAQTQLPAPRGDIVDASGAPLARSRVLLRLSVAPKEARDARKLARQLGRHGVPAEWTRRVADTKRAWVDLPGVFPQGQVADVVGSRGVYVTPVGQRVYATSDGVKRIVGRTNTLGEAVDGIELALDSLLEGEVGKSRMMRDAKGGKLTNPEATTEAPRAGHTVSLTLNLTLQDICDRALADAVATVGATGGDIVVVDPNTGEILAMATKRSDPRSTGSTALTEPFQPGSTLKPFFAAKLLEWKRARPYDSVDTYNGSFRINGRVITDVHAASRLSLTDVLRFSSNIGIVQFVSKHMSDREEYETLRDFGFGTQTGTPYPSEAAGILREPKFWSAQSAASLAIGYEIAVTPLQLALAYAAIANGGELLEPNLVKEIRAPDGTVIYRASRRVVRRVTTPEAAQTVRGMLEAVVDSGTAKDASLATFVVAGKSGTARLVKNGRYAPGAYTASFVGVFPAERPQFVVLVKLDVDDPSGGYYGGKIAAPVSRVVLQAAIASRDAALDRGGLTARRAPKPRVVDSLTEAMRVAAADTMHPVRAAPIAELPDDSSGVERAVPFVVNLEQPVADTKAAPRVRPVPDVRGLPLRRAVKVLHDSGFRVQLTQGAPGVTNPVAGTPAREGTIVRLSQNQ
jgi:cell division protein FtsI (penicillin-binding protein 3)